MSNVFTAGRGLNAFDLTRLGAAIDGTYVFPDTAGGVVTVSSGLTVAISAIQAGAVVINGITETTAYAGGTATCSAADPTNPRIDSVYYDQTGAVAIAAGTAVAVTATTGPVPPTLAANQIRVADIYVAPTKTTLTSNDLTDRRQAASPVVIMKSATETVNNSSTLQSDDDLKFTAVASTDYYVKACLLLSTNTTADWKFAWTLTNATWDGTYQSGITPTTTIDTTSTATGITSGTAKTVNITTNNATSQLWMATFVIHSGATGGTLNFQWAQNAADVSDTQLLKNSWMMVRRLGAS